MPAMKPPRFLRPLFARTGMLFGLLTVIAVVLLSPWSWRWSTRGVLGWDAGVLVFLGLSLRTILKRSSPEAMGRRARNMDEGRGAILLISLVACVASLATAGVEMKAAQEAHGVFKGLRLALMIGTVGLSWLFVHMVFALHYIHEFYLPDPPKGVDRVVGEDEKRERAKAPGEPRRGGLDFPGEDETPDFWDFLHFALVIGVANQTADVQITSKTLRRIATIHCMTAFVFNTAILALTINMAASLI